MNDDFLRDAWRRPPAAFEKQLRERLRQQEQAATTRRPRSWGLLVASILIGGSAFATATYLTTKHFSIRWSGVAQTQEPPVALDGRQNPQRTLVELSDGVANGTRHASPSVESSSTGLAAAASTYAMAPASAAVGPVRLAISPQLSELAEFFSREPRYASVQVDMADADSALPALCAEGSPSNDVVISTRRMNSSELRLCNGTGDGVVMEATLGHMAVVVTRAKAGSSMQLTADAVLRALLKRVPSPQAHDQLIDNPYTDWSQIDSSLESHRIEVFGPARDSVEFRMLAATILDPACERYPALKSLRSTDQRAYEEICYGLREDGAYKSVPLDNTFVSQRLWADPALVAVVDYAFYVSNSTDLAGSLLTGSPPTSQSIVDGSYPAARGIYLYARRSRYQRTPSVRNFIDDYLRRLTIPNNHRWSITADGNLHSWQRPYQPLQLTEISFDKQRRQP